MLEEGLSIAGGGAGEGRYVSSREETSAARGSSCSGDGVTRLGASDALMAVPCAAHRMARGAPRVQGGLAILEGLVSRRIEGRYGIFKAKSKGTQVVLVGRRGSTPRRTVQVIPSGVR